MAYVAGRAASGKRDATEGSITTRLRQVAAFTVVLLAVSTVPALADPNPIDVRVVSEAEAEKLPTAVDGAEG